MNKDYLAKTDAKIPTGTFEITSWNDSATVTTTTAVAMPAPWEALVKLPTSWAGEVMIALTLALSVIAAVAMRKLNMA